MEEKTYEVPIRDMRMSKRNKIFCVRVNERGAVLEYMTQNISDFRSVTEQEMREQIATYLNEHKSVS